MIPCPECVQLKLEYAHLIAEHIRLAGHQHIAHVQGDYEREKTISVETEKAGEARRAALQAITEHEAAAHATTGGQPCRETGDLRYRKLVTPCHDSKFNSLGVIG